MHSSSLDVIRCVKCHCELDLTLYKDDKEIEEGILTCTNCGLVYPVIQGIAILIDNLALYLSNRQKLGGELLLSAKNPQMKSMIKTALGKSTKNPDFSIIEKKWTEVYQKNQDSKFYDAIKKSLNFDSDLSLEHGCSIGIISKHLAKKSKTAFGIDKSFYAISVAKKQEQKNLDFFIADSLEHPFGDTKFNLLVGLNLFELIEPKHLLKLFSEQIQKNGTLVLSDPYDYERDVKSIKEPMSSDDVRKALANLGFVVSEKTEKPSNIPWNLHLHERATLQYLADLIIAKKS